MSAKKARPVMRCSTCGMEKRKLERVKNGWACWRCIMAAVRMARDGLARGKKDAEVAP